MTVSVGNNKFYMKLSRLRIVSTASSTMTESVGNETIENTGDFCLVIGTDHALTGFFNLR
jgi:hypothetical protein